MSEDKTKKTGDVTTTTRESRTTDRGDGTKERWCDG